MKDFNNTLIDNDRKSLFFRRTKIIASAGPASSSEEMIEQLIRKGVNVFRINFSHGLADEHLIVIERIRMISEKINMPVAVLGDLCGPKVRVGKFKNDGVCISVGKEVNITVEDIIGDENIIPSQYKGLVKEVNINDKILLDDGKLELKVLSKDEKFVRAIVIRGGILKNNKGMNLPDTEMNIAALTEKDKNDALYCIKGKVDYIALSFVRKAADINDLKNLLKCNNADIPIIAKIEKPEALVNINEILEISDGIMIARGDLGVEMPPQQVPIIQNKLIQRANQFNKPVIVATQMLESMIENSRPTRAEVTDVAGACTAGADAVMLSGETAVGAFPLETVEFMDSILRETESYLFFSTGGNFRTYEKLANDELNFAIGKSVSQLAKDLMIRCIIVKTNSGYTAKMLASDRPSAPVIAFTFDINTYRELNLIWGVYPYLLSEKNKENYMVQGEKILKDLNLAQKGDHTIVISRAGKIDLYANIIEIHKIK